MIRRSIFAAALALLAGAAQAEPVKFQLSWRPQSEHGGFFQAVATGIYKKYGLDVTLVPGGPQVNTQMAMLSGVADLAMGSNSFNAFNYVKEGIPITIVAAFFQKNPVSILAHPQITRLEDLKGHPIYVSAIAGPTWWNFLRVKFGFTNDQMKPYAFTLAPFLSDPQSGNQGFSTNEPFQAERAGLKPSVFQLSSYGYDDYAYTVEAPKKLIDASPDLLQRFIDASIEGWVSYLQGDPSPGNAAILAANPDMSADVIAFGIGQMKARGLIQGGDAETLGVGAMTDTRWKSFFDFTVDAGLYPATLDYKSGYSMRFVNKKVALAAK